MLPALVLAVLAPIAVPSDKLLAIATDPLLLEDARELQKELLHHR